MKIPVKKLLTKALKWLGREVKEEAEQELEKQLNKRTPPPVPGPSR